MFSGNDAAPVGGSQEALRRPSALRDTVTLALMHKHLYEYMRDTSIHLEPMTRDLRSAAGSRPIQPI